MHVIAAADGPVTPVGIEQRAEAVDGVASAAAVGVGPVGTQQVVVVVARAGARRPAPRCAAARRGPADRRHPRGRGRAGRGGAGGGRPARRHPARGEDRPHPRREVGGAGAGRRAGGPTAVTPARAHRSPPAHPRARAHRSPHALRCARAGRGVHEPRCGGAGPPARHGWAGRPAAGAVRVLVTGARGMLGGAVARALAEARRRRDRAAGVSGLPVREVRADLGDPAAPWPRRWPDRTPWCTSPRRSTWSGRGGVRADERRRDPAAARCRPRRGGRAVRARVVAVGGARRRRARRCGCRPGRSGPRPRPPRPQQGVGGAGGAGRERKTRVHKRRTRVHRRNAGTRAAGGGRRAAAPGLGARRRAARRPDRRPRPIRAARGRRHRQR